MCFDFQQRLAPKLNETWRRVIFCSAMNIASTKLNTGSFTTEKSAIFDIIGNPGLLCLIGSSMFLNLKEAGNLEVNEGTDALCDVVTARSVSDLHFAAPASSFPSMRMYIFSSFSQQTDFIILDSE